MLKPESELQVAQMFDRISKRYDFLNRLLSAGRDQQWRDELVREIPNRPGGAFLDVATGTGDVLLKVKQDHPEYRTYIGIDISEKMLNLARDKAIAEKTLQFLPMSAQSLTFADQTFDALSISFGLRNVVDKEQALAEFSRVLKPHGVLLILEFFKAEGRFFEGIFQFYFHYILPIIGRIFSEKQAYEYLPASVQSFYSQEGLLCALNKCGFTSEVKKNFLFGSCKLVVARKRP